MSVDKLFHGNGISVRNDTHFVTAVTKWVSWLHGKRVWYSYSS